MSGYVYINVIIIYIGWAIRCALESFSHPTLTLPMYSQGLGIVTQARGTPLSLPLIVAKSAITSECSTQHMQGSIRSIVKHRSMPGG